MMYRPHTAPRGSGGASSPLHAWSLATVCAYAGSSSGEFLGGRDISGGLMNVGPPVARSGEGQRTVNERSTGPGERSADDQALRSAREAALALPAAHRADGGLHRRAGE